MSVAVAPGRGPLSLLAVALAGAGASAASAHAAPATAAVRLELDRCLAVDRRELVRLARIELHAAVVTAAGAPAATVVKVGCAADGAYEVSIPGDAGGEGLRRRVAVAGVAEDLRPRVLALAIADFVAVRPTARPAPPAPPPPPPSAPPPPVVVARPAPPTPSSLGAGALFGARLLARNEAALFGGGVRAGWRRGPLTAGLDLLFETGRRGIDVGEARLRAVSAAPTIGAALGARTWRLGAAVGLRAGHATIRGTPDRPTLDGDRVSGAFAAPIAQLEGAARLGPIWSGLRVEGGAVLAPVVGRALGRRAEIGGAFVATWLELGLAR